MLEEIEGKNESLNHSRMSSGESERRKKIKSRGKDAKNEHLSAEK